MGDHWIMTAVGIGFPLFGLGVFFFWRWKYGVWSPRFQGKRYPADATIIQVGPMAPMAPQSSEVAADQRSRNQG